jgi:hypothetical protein
MRAKRTVTIPPPIAILLELLVAHAIEPEAALKLIGVNVAKAQAKPRPSRSTRPGASSRPPDLAALTSRLDVIGKNA